MGYSHYWYRKKEYTQKKFDAFVTDVKAIIEKGGVPIRGNDGNGEPNVNSGIVAFNGDAESGNNHETFFFPRTITQEHLKYHREYENGIFFFCKTARKPYDNVVTACLIAVKEHFPDIKVSSDGDTGEWEDGLKLYALATGRVAVWPVSKDE